MRPTVPFLLIFGFCLLAFSCQQKREKLKSGPRRIEVLFLGHNSEHHHSARYLPMLASALSREGINFTYTEDPESLNPETLAYYDGLMIYANHEQMTPSQEEALLDFVAEGKGFIPVHSASFCFQNSPEYIRLVGGQFQKHETGIVRADIVNKDHPVTASLDTFLTWDETYVHHKLSDDRTVLMERVEGEHREPWTWVKEHGKGRVFYTAYGHDDRAWSNPGFHELLKQGIVWAVGDEVRDQWQSFVNDMPELKYRPEANIPNYEKRNPRPQYQEPLSPEESAKLIQVPSGFDLELFASEPDIINPVAMDWDERGRLWVIETVDYPNTVRNDKGQGDDRIKICEDTDGDGKADKFTIFADGLNIPTSLVFANGGIIVSQAPVFFFLKDTDGDDRADVKEVIMDGWGTFDTHAGPSNLKYGFDNQIWGVVGYSGFKGTIAGEPREFRQGVYRFAPDVSSFEFLTRTTNNTWGLGFTENNDVFASTANNTHSVYMGIPDRLTQGVQGIELSSPKIDGHYAMHPITEKVRQVDVFGGFTAASGHNFYMARQYPEEYWSQVAFVAEPTGHLVHIARIKEKGAGFLEEDGWNLFASADEWVAPVEAKVGPDGAVWVLDWYNFIVQHNPTPTPDRGGYAAVNGPGNAYENPLRDRSHGRIWRVVYRGAEKPKALTLSRDDSDQLIKALSHDNHFWRMTAQRLLVETQNVDVLPKLYDLIEERGDKGDEAFAATHALWVLDGLRVIRSGNEAFQVVTRALKHPAPTVRKAAIQVLSGIQWTDKAILESGILEDPDPNTRMAALLSLASAAPSDQLGEKLFEISKEEEVQNDVWLSRAVYVAAAHHPRGFTSAFQKTNPTFTTAKTEQRREVPAYGDSEWHTMDLPQSIEEGGLDMDGIVWFRREVDLSQASASTTGVLSLGPIDDSDEAWINGVKVGGVENQYAKFRKYTIPRGVLKRGKNLIAVKVVDTGSRGGFHGQPDDMFLQAGAKKLALDGPWKYDVEKDFGAAAASPFENTSLAETFFINYRDHVQQSDVSVKGEEPAAAGKQVIKIKALVNEMKFDLKTFTVEAGKRVEVVFENPDFMQHNFVIVKPGALETVGRAADKLATDANGAEMNYVPRIPEVLFHTALVNPEQSVTLEFIAPEQPGDYPFVCTFPGHWSIMNGVMKVFKDQSAL